MTELETLRIENQALKERLARLMEEVSFLRTHFTLAQGMRGETIIRRLTSGTLAAKYAQTFDLKVGDEVNVEIKFSKLVTRAEPSRPHGGTEWRSFAVPASLLSATTF